MATHELTTSWKGKMAFEANINGHLLLMDANEAGGGDNSAPSPKPLVLTALSGCTGMDVVSIMRKMRKEPNSFDLLVKAELTDTHPKEYCAIHLEYRIEAPANYREAALQAVVLSQEKYCGVNSMLKKIMPVTHTILFNGEVIKDSRPA
jgi:putative redox protein